MAKDIRREADNLFDEMLQVSDPEFRLVFKDIALEDLQDADFMSSLRQVMEPSCSPEDLEKLFEISNAAPTKKPSPSL